MNRDNDKKRNAHALESQGKREKVKKMEESLTDMDRRESGIQRQIDELTEALGKLKKISGEAKAEYLKAFKIVEALTDLELEDEDTAEIVQQMQEAEATNTKARQNKQRANQVAARDIWLAESMTLTDDLGEIDKDKADQLAAANFPIEGLSFDETGVRYQGLPFDQASSAEQLRVSVAMGIATNPKLRVMLVREGSLLDSESLALLRDLAEEHDTQIFLERVGTGEEMQVIIEDGQGVESADLPLPADTIDRLDVLDEGQDAIQPAIPAS